MKSLIFALLVSVVAAGCGTTYSWRSNVPENARTVSVPTFRNETDLTELGSVVTRQTLREFQREGTFKIKAAADAALEIQGVVKEVAAGSVAYDRRQNLRRSAYNFSVKAEISVIDKRSGKVLIDNRQFEASTTFTSGNDIDTAKRDASGRLADELARRIVDAVLNLKLEK